MMSEMSDCLGMSSAPFSSVGVVGAGLIIVAACCQWAVSSAGDRKTFNTVNDIPPNEVGVVLGTARLLLDRRPNLFFLNRMEAAAKLYRAGKVKRLILSGRVDPDGYNEPEDMRRDLCALDVPPECLILDPEGFRTIESIKRAREYFGLTRLTVISQEFHNRRALFFCRWYGIEAVGLNADFPGWRKSWRTALREFAARLVAVSDVLREALFRLTIKPETSDNA
jgi:SanA protein